MRRRRLSKPIRLLLVLPPVSLALFVASGLPWDRWWGVIQQEAELVGFLMMTALTAVMLLLMRSVNYVQGQVDEE